MIVGTWIVKNVCCTLNTFRFQNAKVTVAADVATTLCVCHLTTAESTMCGRDSSRQNGGKTLVETIGRAYCA